MRDDGPTIKLDKILAADTLQVDETTLATNASANFADNFAPAISYGEDGAGKTTYSLVLTGTNVASGLYAIDPTDTSAGDGDGIGQGAQILLSQTGNVITGSVGATPYFTITIDPNTGVVTLDQLKAIWHTNTGSPDDVSTLTATANALVVKATVVDADGDTATANIDLSTGVFSMRDDGPTIKLDKILAADTLQVDETTLATNASANFADNFAPAISYGEDGAGKTTYSLVLTGTNVASGLYAIDPTDTSAGDGDGIGQGAQILLSQTGNVITGSVGATPYFTVTIDPNTGVVTLDQLKAIWHTNTGSPDDVSTLTATANALVVKATVVDADGDTATANIDLSTGVFSMRDDGPTIKLDIRKRNSRPGFLPPPWLNSRSPTLLLRTSRICVHHWFLACSRRSNLTNHAAFPPLGCSRPVACLSNETVRITSVWRWRLLLRKILLNAVGSSVRQLISTLQKVSRSCSRARQELISRGRHYSPLRRLIVAGRPVRPPSLVRCSKDGLLNSALSIWRWLRRSVLKVRFTPAYLPFFPRSSRLRVRIVATSRLASSRLHCAISRWWSTRLCSLPRFRRPWRNSPARPPAMFSRWKPLRSSMCIKALVCPRGKRALVSPSYSALPSARSPMTR